MTIVQLTSNPNCNGAGSYYPSIDSAGKKIAFTSWCDLVPGGNSDGNSELFVIDVGRYGLDAAHFHVGGSGANEPAISPNGQKSRFCVRLGSGTGHNADLNSEIFVVNIDGSGLRQLTHTTGGDLNNFGGNTHPRIDPEDKRITFSSDLDLVSGHNSDGNHELFLINIDGPGVTQLTNTTGGYGVFDSGQVWIQPAPKVIFDSDRDMVPGRQYSTETSRST